MEFSDLGKHCAICNLQDYLPFNCPGCKHWYCSDHRAYESHNCKNKPIDKQKTNQILKNAIRYKCSYKNCREKSIYKFVCPTCMKNHCISHRQHMIHG